MAEILLITSLANAQLLFCCIFNLDITLAQYLIYSVSYMYISSINRAN